MSTTIHLLSKAGTTPHCGSKSKDITASRKLATCANCLAALRADEAAR